MAPTNRNNYSRQIADLINYKGDNYGLYGGKAGQAILLYLLSESNQPNTLKDSALQLLEDISDNIVKIDYLDFANGLAGIGWTVEWVAQNGFLAMNTDEILEDLDDAMYKSVVYSSDQDISLASGTLGKILFFFYRHKSKNPNTHRLKSIFHEECLVLLTDDLYEKICGDAGLIEKGEFSDDDLINTGHLIYIVSDFLWSKINEPTVEKLLYETIKFVDGFIDNYINTKLSDSKNNAILFLSFCYYLAGKSHKQSLWQTRAWRFIKIMESTKNSNQKSADIETLNEILRNIIDGKWEILPPEDIIISNICLKSRQGKLLLYNLLLEARQEYDLSFWLNFLILL